MLLVACGLALAASPVASADYVFETKWGSSGSSDGQFHAPHGVVAGVGGVVYVTDFGSSDRVEKFSSDGAFLGQWGGPGSGDTQFTNPWGIAADSAGNVYVADTGNHYIKKFSSSGAFALKFGGGGSGDGQFGIPFGVAVSSVGDVYVTDHDGGVPLVDRVQKFKPSLGSYAYADQWGETGSESGKFKEPADVAVDPTGNVYVSDRNNHRVQKFDADGFFLDEWGGMGSGDGQFVFPEGIATDQAGNVYVADRGNNRIQKFSSSGDFLAKWGSTGSSDGQFLQPNDVTVDSAGNVYVADTGNDRIQKFVETGGPSGGSGSSGGPSGGSGGSGPAGGELTLEGRPLSSRDGKIKFKLRLPAPGEVEVTARVIPPPRPPSLNPDQREHETGHMRPLKRKKSIVAARVKETVVEAGLLAIALEPNAKTRKFLHWKPALRAEVTIVYTPTGGAPSSVLTQAKFKLVKGKKKPGRSR